jgi:hypothetical protein
MLKLILSATIWGLLSLAGLATAQQANVGAPLNTAGSGFHENIALSWGVQGNGWFFNSGGPAPFGGGAPGGGAMFGGGFGGGGLSGRFRLTAEQGSSTTLGSQSPSVTVMNGGSGYFSDTTIRPFVTGLIPVVGNIPSAPGGPVLGTTSISPVLDRLARLEAEGRLAPPPNREQAPTQKVAAEHALAKPLVPLQGGPAAGAASSAERGDLSVAEIKARNAAATPNVDNELLAYIEKAKSMEADQKPGVARIYYQMAARRAQGEQQLQLLAKLRELDATK